MMNAGDIAFPHLGIYLENVPRSFTVFGFEIAFYGLIIGIGVLAGILMAVHQAKVSGENPDTIWDFAIYAVIFSVIGARIYYVIFAWDYYKDNLLSIFNTRNGGMAIYGGVIGAFLTLFIYCKTKKISPFRLGDLCVPGLILGQAIGRWGNFMNREVFGEYTDNFLAMRLPIEAVRSRDISENVAAHIVEGTNYIQVHPTFLYESLWNLVGFIIIDRWWLRKGHRKYDGQVFLFYVFWYGAGRSWIEGLRTDSLYIPGTNIRTSQLVAALSALTALVILLINIKRPHKPTYAAALSAAAQEAEAAAETEKTEEKNDG